MFTRLIPHVQLLRLLDTQRLFQVVSNLVGIDKETVHALGYIAWSNSIEAVGVNQRIALLHIGTILKGGVAQ